MFTNFNEGAVVSGNTDKTSIIRCSTHSMQDCNRLGGQLYIILMFTNCCSSNKGAVVSGNTDDTTDAVLTRCRVVTD